MQRKHKLGAEEKCRKKIDFKWNISRETLIQLLRHKVQQDHEIPFKKPAWHKLEILITRVQKLRPILMIRRVSIVIRVKHCKILTTDISQQFGTGLLLPQKLDLLSLFPF